MEIKPIPKLVWANVKADKIRKSKVSFSFILWCIGFAVFLSIIAIYFAKSSSELVYVDVNKLITGYSKTKIAKAEFDKKANLMKANVDSLISNWQNELKSYEKERTSFSPKELKLKQY